MALAATDVDMISGSQTGSASWQYQGSVIHSEMDDLYQHEIDHNMTQILSQSRSVRVVLYSSTPAASEHRFWIDSEVTFGGVAKALADMYPSQELVVLQANWGPRPSWTKSNLESRIGSTCRVLYAISNDQAKPYTMAVMRTSLSDYPIPIYIPASESSATVLEAVIASYPELTGQVKSIVPHFGDYDLQGDPWDSAFAQGQPYPAAPLLITTMDEPLKEFLAGSSYEVFSPSASTPSDSNGLIPPLLQISFAECKLLVQRAYELDTFPLQMIHLSEAIFHVVISLARSLNPVFENTSSSIEDALSAEDDLADHLRVAPLLCRQLEELLDAGNGIIDNLELGRLKREEAQRAIEKIFVALCGDLPGAVTVRSSEKDFREFGSIDCEGLDTLVLDTLDVESVGMAYGESIMEDGRVANVDPPFEPTSKILPEHPTDPPSSSHIVRRRPSAQHRSYASGSTVDPSDPQHTSHFSSFIGVHRTATSTSSISAPSTSAGVRFHPYATSDTTIEARHGQSAWASLSSAEPVGLQSMPSQNGHLKLSLQEHASRSGLLRNETWFNNQTEEPPITGVDEFVRREYIGVAEKSRFNAFVGIDPRARRAVCRIPHNITVKGKSVPCTYEKANVKEAIAHVSIYFGYKGYKCQIEEPGHSCEKRFPTREQRDDHQSKARKRPDARIQCDLCNKIMLERNMRRHKMGCKGQTETEAQAEIQGYI